MLGAAPGSRFMSGLSRIRSERRSALLVQTGRRRGGASTGSRRSSVRVGTGQWSIRERSTVPMFNLMFVSQKHIVEVPIGGFEPPGLSFV